MIGSIIKPRYIPPVAPKKSGQGKENEQERGKSFHNFAIKNTGIYSNVFECFPNGLLPRLCRKCTDPKCADNIDRFPPPSP